MTRVALVTGAARGIGAATVRRLAADGWSVLATDRASDDPRLPYPLGTQEELALVAEAAGELGGGEVAWRAADASDLGAMAAAVADAEARFGAGLDAVVAVAGAMAGGVPQWELDPAAEAAVLDANLVSALVTARAGIPALLRRAEPRDGRFVAVASTAASRGLPLLAAYCAAKAGVVGLVRALGAELRDTGVTANAVSPGSTRTDILTETARLYGMDSRERFAEQAPIGRLLDPDEIAATIAWLAGDGGRAATGAEFPVDGGLSI